jgi:putative PEP-CTERM system TPR-repeat lipoprotein
VEGKLDVARQRVTQLVKGDIRNIEAMMLLAAVEDAAANIPEAVRWLEKARAEPRGALQAGMALGELHLRARNPELALSVARELVAKNPENLAALALLTRVQLAKNDTKSAQQTLKDMTRYANFDPAAQLEIARLQMAAGNDSGAIYSLDKALDTRPDFLPALVMYAEIEIHRKAYPKAEQRINAIGDKFPAGATAARLRGDLALARGQHGAALISYGDALKKENTGDIALRTFRAYLGSGDLAKGVAFLEKWHREHPNDQSVLRTIADGQLRLGRLKEARAAYEKLLQALPENGSVLNNLAIVADKLGDKGAANLAERAYNARANDPIVIDTLGWILVRQGQTDRGLGLLRDARLRDPGNPEVRYHLAVALSKTGRTNEAREELAEALKAAVSFDGLDDAKKLARELDK